MSKKDKEIMTTQEVAEYLNLHPLTVHRHAREGKIPAFKIGTDWRFHRKHIEKWIMDKVTYNIQGKDRRKQTFETNLKNSLASLKENENAR